MDLKLTRPKPTSSFLRDLSGLAEIPRLLVRYPELARQPRGDGSRVMVLPGFLADDISTFLLRAYLKKLGHQAIGWGEGRNTGKVEPLLERLAQRVSVLYQQKNEPIALVGWSLGGYLAREVARDLPDAVSQVITLASPVVGGPKYTLAANYYENVMGVDLDELEKIIADRDDVPLKVPVTAFYTKSDAVVAWPACIDHVNPTVRHIEVKTTHIGIGFNPEVFCGIARTLVSQRASGAEKTSEPKSVKP